MGVKPLTAKQQRFVEEYLVDLNATQATIRAGYSPKRANMIGYENLRKPEIAAAISAAQEERSRRTGITADRILQRLWAIATADPRDLVQVKVGCCRYCWGEGHRFQRSVGEMNKDRERWVQQGNAMADFDEQGGIGFDPLRSPAGDCPECGGDGAARVALADTRKLSAAASTLYAGAKQGRYGIEVQLHSQLDAMEKLMRHLGAYEKDNRQRADPIREMLQSLSGNVLGPVRDDPGVLDDADDNEGP